MDRRGDVNRGRAFLISERKKAEEVMKNMAKKSRGGRMTAAKRRAAKSKGGRGPVKKRKAGRKVMRT